mgnify:FL=1
MQFSLSFSRILPLLLAVGLLLPGCDAVDITDEPDPNGPSLGGVVNDPTQDKILNAASGIEAGMRTDINLYLSDVSMIGREVYRFSASDPRFTADLLGAGTAVLDNNTFYITRPWAERFRVVRSANILNQALDNASEGLFSAGEVAHLRGTASTFAAYQLLLNANLTFQNGLIVEGGVDEPGPVVDYDPALQAIADQLDAAHDQLTSAGDATAFPLSEGFDDVTMVQVNRALAARVALYQKDYDRALTLVNNAFITPGAPLDVGAYHVFSTSPGDVVNPWFIPPQQSGEVLAAHPSFMDDIRPNDNRESKVVERDDPFAADGLASDFGFFVYKTQTSPIPIIRHAELLLIRAEANLLKATPDLNAVVDDLNIIRNAAGLGDYSGTVSADALEEELLYQRRYELYGEGHRWVDVRRILGSDCDSNAGCLNDDLPIDRPDDNVWRQFPIPANENV